MNKYLKSFGHHFLMGGLIIGLYSVITEYISPAYAAHISSSLPIVFTYIIVITYNKYGLDKAINTSYLAFFAGLIWQLYVIVFFFGLKSKLGIMKSAVICLTLYVIMSYLLYNYFIDYY